MRGIIASYYRRRLSCEKCYSDLIEISDFLTIYSVFDPYKHIYFNETVFPVYVDTESKYSLITDKDTHKSCGMMLMCKEKFPSLVCAECGSMLTVTDVENKEEANCSVLDFHVSVKEINDHIAHNYILYGNINDHVTVSDAKLSKYTFLKNATDPLLRSYYESFNQERYLTYTVEYFQSKYLERYLSNILFSREYEEENK